jgi:RNA polymerase sigma factor (sigma-70 family)
MAEEQNEIPLGLPEPIRFGDLNDEELVFLMRDDPTVAPQAWGEFYTRHFKYVYGILWHSWGRSRPSEIPDIVQETFIRVYTHADSYKSPEKKSGKPLRVYIRAWLGMIAKSILISDFRSENIESKIEFERSEQQRSGSPPPSSRRLQLIEEALSALSEREATILRFTGMWYCPGKQLRIPSAELKQLASEYKVTVQSIRKIRERAIQKVRKYIEAKANVLTYKQGQKQGYDDENG